MTDSKANSKKSTSLDSNTTDQTAAAHEEFANDLNINKTITDDVLAENVSYGPGGLRGIIGSPFVFGAALLASLGGFSFGYDQGVISIINVMPQFWAQYPETDPRNPGSGFYTGFMTGMLELGAFLGCFFMPWLADRVSRKGALSIVVVIFNIGAIIQTASHNYATLVVGRAIGGIGVGTLALGAPLYISEIAPPQLRGALLVLESVSIVSGALIAYWITYGTKELSGAAAFRLPFGLQMVCATVLGICIWLFPYSPRWLALRGRTDDSLHSLAKLRQLPPSDERVQKEWRGIMAEVAFQHAMQEKDHPGKTGFKLEVASWLDLFKSKTIRRTLVACGIAFFQQFSGINAFVYYAPRLFREMGQSDDLSLILAGMINLIQLVGACIAFVLMDKWGRRPLAVWGGFGMCMPYFVLAGLIGAYAADWESAQGPAWAAVAMAYLYVFVYACSYSPLGWALPAEVFSNASRAKGVALATATVWICNTVIGIVVPLMIEDLGVGGFGTYVFFGCFCLLGGVFSYFLVPETAGKSLEDLDSVFNDHSADEERAALRQAAVIASRRSDTRREDGDGMLV